eukprot:5459434-Amphidinium_carterae.2
MPSKIKGTNLLTEAFSRLKESLRSTLPTLDAQRFLHDLFWTPLLGRGDEGGADYPMCCNL